MPPGNPPTTSRGEVLRLAAPMVFANAAEPLAGVVDTAIIGRVGDGTMLASVAFGVTLTQLVTHNFYFLRMSATGLTARAAGAEDRAETQRVLLRGGALALTLGLLALLMSGVVEAIAVALFEAEPAVEAAGARYYFIRALGFPASFLSYVASGWLIALGQTRWALLQQLGFSLGNIALDLVFVAGLGWGVEGAAIATTGARHLGVGLAAFAIVRVVRGEGGWAAERSLRGALELLRPGAIRPLLSMSVDFMIRTWAMQAGFAWFTNAAARISTVALGASHVLLQLVSLCSFVLDAFAFVAESLVGRAVGSGSKPRFWSAIRKTSELALVFGAILAATIYWGGPRALEWTVKDEGVRATALALLPLCALVPLLGAPAWQLDGIFVGATRSAAMRNASVASALAYVAIDLSLGRSLGLHGIWIAFIAFYLFRAASLSVAFPRLVRDAFPETGKNDALPCSASNGRSEP